MGRPRAQHARGKLQCEFVGRICGQLAGISGCSRLQCHVVLRNPVQVALDLYSGERVSHWGRYPHQMWSRAVQRGKRNSLHRLRRGEVRGQHGAYLLGLHRCVSRRDVRRCPRRHLVPVCRLVSCGSVWGHGWADVSQLLWCLCRGVRLPLRLHQRYSCRVPSGSLQLVWCGCVH